jgi:hypothetical protein
MTTRTEKAKTIAARAAKVLEDEIRDELDHAELDGYADGYDDALTHAVINLRFYGFDHLSYIVEELR